MYQTLCRAYRDPGRIRKEKDPIEERTKLLVLFSISRYPKLPFSITTDQLARSGLISSENDNLGERERENETGNFGRCSLGRAALNWMMTAEVVGLVLQFSFS